MRPNESFGMALIGLAENLLPSWNDVLRPAIVEHCRRRQANAAVMVPGVAAGEEDLAEAARIVNGAEAVRELGAVLQRFEATLRERAVAGNMWAAVRLGQAPIRQQEGHRLGGHRGAAIGMDGELPRCRASSGRQGDTLWRRLNRCGSFS